MRSGKASTASEAVQRVYDGPPRTPKAALTELLDRIGAQRGAAVLIDADELREWPDAAVAAMKAHGLLTKASPARSTVCPGCEEQCIMPVYVVSAPERAPNVFIVCDQRDDASRVTISVDRLEQWQATGEAVAALLVKLLEWPWPLGISNTANRWEVGEFARPRRRLDLIANGRLALSFQGHLYPVTDILNIATTPRGAKLALRLSPANKLRRRQASTRSEDARATTRKN